ncbi:hypothetical protein BKA04_000849 [Cryobacterium mesophilum]|uniref:Membrane-anchored glycerophosphoryl diester phosphodiesterase (GDPDase), membrane domain n=1 Tax=Terrimesophilobacter mesophilus TaxID=433647 RepID=A0A4R8V9B4_9MICO|nr:hypothetical protein [Terrimesophilobacter mesophilus]MBB5632626.1 hypothetical protein [Terrimesophilobacter mesophilus]TFB79439.1 hypothetical protein E3N84_04855 [Terrimesophilobacter mesophilus]
MSDERPWQAPDAPRANPAPPSSPLPPPSSPPVPGPPGYGPPLPDPALGAAGTAWAPPPKPGLIPLRPLDLGTMLGASFRVLRRNPRPTFGAALLIQGVVTIITTLAVGGATFASLSRLDSAAPDDAGAIVAGTVAFAVISALLSVILSLIASALLQGIIVVEVARGALGEKLRLRQLWGFARGRIWALVGWAALVAAAFLVVILIFVGIIVLLSVTLGGLGILLSVMFGVIGGLGLVVLGCWIGTRVSLVPSALILERLPLRAAIVRSWTLTRGFFWKVFGIQLLVMVILWIASNIALTPFSLLAPILLVLLDPNGTGSSVAVVATVGVYILQLVVTVVLSAITSIISTATSALIYLDLRMRKEGLELELVKFVEARQAGSASTENPYLRPVAVA